MLKNMDYFEAHQSLRYNGWKLDHVEYPEESDQDTTRMIHAFRDNDTLKAVAVEDQPLGLDYVDFYGEDSDVLQTAAEHLEGYTEAELQGAAAQVQAPDELPALLLKVGLTALTHNPPWKQAFIERHIRQGVRETRCAALLAATLAVDPVFLPAMRDAAQDEDPEVQTYSAGLLQVLDTGGHPAPGTAGLSGPGQRPSVDQPAADRSTERRQALIQAALTAPVGETVAWMSPLANGTSESPQASPWTRPRRRVLVKTEAWSASLFLRAGGWTVVDWESEEEEGEVLAARYVYVHAGGADVRAEIVGTLGLTFVDFYGDDEGEMDRATRLLDGVYTEEELRVAATRATTGAELNEVLLQLGITAATSNPAWKRSFIEGHLNFAPALQRKAAMLGATFSMDPVFLPAIEQAAEDDSADGDDVDVQHFARALLDVWATRHPA
ncbi:hypothetical protein [Deinococcus sp. RIT780]|uniref:hypothetical protein n=1 Tax=Deinococcus sp. RIT780 TaxID=2870472 RepID=UPI001C893575|nr:hypothetical protein [Deinococcus sp. RIT780]MBX8463540.1 hypothetical protein [Deinococcus sp. RIT780]